MSTWQEEAREDLARAIAGAMQERHRLPANSMCKHCSDAWSAADAALAHLAPVVEAEVRRGQAEALRDMAGQIRAAIGPVVPHKGGSAGVYTNASNGDYCGGPAMGGDR